MPNANLKPQPGIFALDWARLGQVSVLVGGLGVLWAFTHRFAGLSGDGELYAVQALSRLLPNLLADLYLQNTTQDHYTIFSPIYAFVIARAGLVPAAVLLFAVFTVWLLGAARSLAATLFDADLAWLSVAAIIIVGGVYGAFNVVSYTENYVTARSMAEAMVISAVVLNLKGWRTSSIALVAAALAVHPIMALPGLVLVICVSLPRRWALAGAVLGLIAVLAGTVVISLCPPLPGLLRVISGDWYEVVLERSQFLFIQHWNVAGYEGAARTFICLLLTYHVFPDQRIRTFCFAAILVGLSGLALNAVGSLVSPIAVLVQGQPWRWMWITTFCAILALPPTIAAMLRDRQAGWLCALALTLGWVYSEVDGTACCVGALLLWLVRKRISPFGVRIVRIGSVLAALIVLVEVVANAVTLQSTPEMDHERESLWIAHIREVFALGVPAALFAYFSWRWALSLRSARTVAISLLITGACASFMLPKALKAVGSVGTQDEISRFAEWRQKIPPQSTVWVYPSRVSSAFPWFSLQRPSYLTTNQSAGVVFSDVTAAEIRRRSDILLPVTDPDWRLYSRILHGESKSKKTLDAHTLPLICQDPALGFVVAQPSLGYESLTYHGPGSWHDWHLYDCSLVRTRAPT